jgi:hypothetical protein
MRTVGQTGKTDISLKIFVLLRSYAALTGGCRLFGTTSPLLSGQTDCPETSVTNYQ